MHRARNKIGQAAGFGQKAKPREAKLDLRRDAEFLLDRRCRIAKSRLQIVGLMLVVEPHIAGQGAARRDDIGGRVANIN